MRQCPTGWLCLVMLIMVWLGCAPAAVYASERRTALVIGNARYPVGPLNNPVNDARLMERTLRELGFELVQLESNVNVSQKAFEEAVDTLRQQLAQHRGVGLFYFAGHGMQDLNGQNYLMPIDARITSAADVKRFGVPVEWIVDKMMDAGNRLNILILDACRDNPYARAVRSNTRGLGRVAAPGGTLIAYAAAPGMVAQDGTGENSVYTLSLAREMRQPGLDIAQVFRRVRAAVLQATGNAQRPEEFSNLVQDFTFVEGPSMPPPPPPSMRNSIGMEFVRIPAGEFRMGADDGDNDEKPAHWVRISQAFDMAKYETTQEQWEAVMGNNPSAFKHPRRPVESVTYDEVQEFIRRLNTREGGTTYRLPTEAEWEYAARGSEGRRYPWGNAWNGRALNFCDRNCEFSWKDKEADDGYATTAPVGSYPAGQSPFGVYDMAGNVWEWVEDWYSADAYQNRTPAGVSSQRAAASIGTPAVNPRGPAAGSGRVIRGGSWLNVAGFCRAANRSNGDPGSRNDGLGFRLLRITQ